MAREDAANPLGHRAAAALGAAALAVAGLEYVPAMVALGQWSPLRVLPGELCRWRGPGSRPDVALTFDDGPDPDVTPEVLHSLDQMDLRATFFVLAERAAAYPALVAEIARRGHLLATHGDRHASHLLRSPGAVRRDMQRAQDVMTSLGHPPRWFRPPFGHATAATLTAARSMGWRTVLWSAWGREWSSADGGQVAGRVARRLGPGAVVLLHDSAAQGPPGMAGRVLEALPLIGLELQRRRLRAVTLDDLVADGGMGDPGGNGRDEPV